MNKIVTINIVIALISLAIFVPFLGGVRLFDWDEINFAESAREMIISGDYLTVRINYLPFWEKPPLFIWLQVFTMRLFGINEFAARFPNAICGTVTLLILFNTGRKLFSEKFGLIWVLTYAGSLLPFFYFKSGIIDPWFNLFIFLGIHQFIRYSQIQSKWYIILSAIYVGLGILTKGPAALLIFLLVTGIYWILNRSRMSITIRDAILFVLILVFTGGFWFILQMVNGNFKIIADFIAYQIRLFRTEDAGHGGFLLYHFVVLLIGVFPASVFALGGFTKMRHHTEEQKNYHRWMLILFCVVLILFTIVNTKIIHYSSLCYFPLTFMAARMIFHHLENKLPFRKWITAGVAILGSAISIVIAFIPHLSRFKNRIAASGLIADDFTRSIIMSDVSWRGYESLTGFLLVSGLITFIIFQKKRQPARAVVLLFSASLLSTLLTILLYTSRIEQYSQGAALDFFQSISDRDAYVETLGYKSYAHLFYAEKKMPSNYNSYNKDWLLTGDIDKNVYFSAKITGKDRILANYPELKLLYEKNGYVFLLREK
jgi:hypothetical protein